MTSESGLPELPHPYYIERGDNSDVWNEAMMRLYGAACYAQAMERAAQICDRINAESGGGFETFGEAIRAEAAAQAKEQQQ